MTHLKLQGFIISIELSYRFKVIINETLLLYMYIEIMISLKK